MLKAEALQYLKFMMLTSTEYLNAIAAKLKTYDRKAVEQMVDNLISLIYSSEENFNTRDAEKIMQQLRNKRMFASMQKVGDALIQTGRHTYKIRRQYAQSLIDQNNLTAALAILQQLVADTSNASTENADAKFENTEARGLSGRVYKQLYVNAKKSAAGYRLNYIKEAVKFYLDVYVGEPAVRTWHGINAVALLKRASTDGIALTGFPSPDDLASSVLQTIKERYDAQTADAWDFATAAEACVSLNDAKEALEWMSGYARMPYCDAFELASTLRQLEEVWQLDMTTEMGKLLLPLLRAELLKREGGTITLDVKELKQQKADENNTSDSYKSLMEEQKSDKAKIVLEKVFGDDSFKTYKWYMTGADRCLAVARIGRDSSKGFGTGFLLKGKVLDDSLGDELILITNAHVISNDSAEKALSANEAIITFEALNNNKEFRAEEIIWSSPSHELDTSIIRFNTEDQELLKTLTEKINLYTPFKYLPVIDDPPSQRIYVIGHPLGGTLQLSFQDNILLDYEVPKIHYRTPTEGGSSGSPVFNQQWDLIGLHHAGSSEMPCLNKKPGTYEANEGIWIQAIKKAMGNR